MSEHKEKQGVAAVFGAIPDMPIDDEQQNIALDAAKWRKAMEGPDSPELKTILHEYAEWAVRCKEPDVWECSSRARNHFKSEVLKRFRALDHARREAEQRVKELESPLPNTVVYVANPTTAADWKHKAEKTQRCLDMAHKREADLLTQLEAEKQAHDLMCGGYAAAMSTLERLTPNTAEFHGDPVKCEMWIQANRDALQRRVEHLEAELYRIVELTSCNERCTPTDSKSCVYHIAADAFEASTQNGGAE
jgi:hypothetical protein